MAGVGFGFIGLALFLLGIKGDLTAGVETSAYAMKLQHLAPGTLVIVAGVVLIGFCANYRVDITSTTQSQARTSDQRNEKTIGQVSGGSTATKGDSRSGTPPEVKVNDPKTHSSH